MSWMVYRTIGILPPNRHTAIPPYHSQHRPQCADHQAPDLIARQEHRLAAVDVLDGSDCLALQGRHK